MIKAKITNQFGAALERELPLDIHQFYHDMREAGINKPPRNILLHDDKGVDLHLSADSEIGSRLLRVFSKGDTLADANTVAFDCQRRNSHRLGAEHYPQPVSHQGNAVR